MRRGDPGRAGQATEGAAMHRASAAALPRPPAAPAIVVLAPAEGAEAEDGHRAWRLGPAILSRLAARQARYGRSPAQIAGDLLDHWAICLALRGEHRLHAPDLEAAVPPGVPVLLSLAEPFEATLRDASFLCLLLPAEGLPELGAALQRARPGPLDTAAGRLLAAFLAGIVEALPGMREAEVPRAVEALRALLAAALAGEAGEAAPDRGLAQAAQLGRLRAIIGQHLRSPELTPDLLCRLSGVSRSHLYRLFAPVGGVAREIQRERLRHAHRAIADRDQPRTVREIGEEFGFPDPSAFSRAFRREFGYAPTELRLRASRPDP